jgi:hypothetical protein
MPQTDYTLPEHPDVTKDRLEQSGEWAGANKILVKHRIKYVRGHARDPNNFMRRLAAEKYAWDHLFEIYPPPSTATPCVSLSDWLVLQKRGVGKGQMPMLEPAAERRFDELGETTDTAKEINFVHHHIDDLMPDPMICPSRGAWTLWTMARADNKWFYDKQYRLLGELAKKKTDAAEGAISKQEKLCREEIEKMIEDALERVKESKGA